MAVIREEEEGKEREGNGLPVSGEMSQLEA